MQKQLGGSAGMLPNGQNINLGWSKFQTFPGEHNPRLLQQYISYYRFILHVLTHQRMCCAWPSSIYPGYTTSTDLAAWSPASNFKVLSWHSPEPSLFWHPKLSFLVSFSWSVGLWLPDPLSPHILGVLLRLWEWDQTRLSFANQGLFPPYIYSKVNRDATQSELPRCWGWVSYVLLPLPHAHHTLLCPCVAQLWKRTKEHFVLQLQNPVSIDQGILLSQDKPFSFYDYRNTSNLLRHSNFNGFFLLLQSSPLY